LEVFMTTGTIKKVVADRGFGFIAAEDSKEYFFHRGGLDSSLDFDRLIGGERVKFEIEASPKGPRATQVRSASANLGDLSGPPPGGPLSYSRR
jgi:CspA family cold shock protein